MSTTAAWHVEVAYAMATSQEVIEVSARPGATVEEVIRASGLLERCPEIDLSHQRVGIYGELAQLQDAVHDGDRVEIYRPLVADPKEIRRQRVARRKPDAR